MRGVLAAAVLLAAGCSGSSRAPTAPTPSAATAFTLTSPVMSAGGTLPIEHTCDGAGLSPPLAWSGAPALTREFALLMTTLPGDGTTKWNWVLYRIPAGATTLPTAVQGVGTFGVGSDGPLAAYQPPCSQGPGAKTYTFTVYALSATPAVSSGTVTGSVLTAALQDRMLASASLSVSYTRSAK